MMSIDKEIEEDAKAWLTSDEGKAALIFAMKEVELSNFELMKASKVKTEYLHEPFVPMLAKFAQIQSARQSAQEPAAWLVIGVGAYVDYERAVRTAQENMRNIYPLYTSPVTNSDAAVQEAVNKFLGWKLPVDFSPDCGISFEQYSNNNPPNGLYKALREPIGTNLFNANQAKQMFEYCLGVEAKEKGNQ